MQTLFVYGTLMEGFHNRRLLSDIDFTSKRVKAKDVTLYDVGHFPALVDGTDTIEGELLEFSDEVFKEILPRLDRLEGYREDDKLNSLYLRMPIDLEVDGQDVRSVAYWWNNSVGNLIRISPDFSSYNDYITYKQSL